MAVAGTRESIIKQFFGSFGTVFGYETEHSEIPTLSSLTKKDLKGMSKDDLKELFMESPKRIVKLAKDVFVKLTPKKRNQNGGGSPSSMNNPERLSGQKEITNIPDKSDGFEIGD